MKISYKDKSLIIFVITVLVLIISMLKITSYLFLVASSSDKNFEKIISVKEENWINTDRRIKKTDLEDRIIILNFWSYSCVSCIDHLSDIKEIEENYGTKVLVISVHSPKFQNEKRITAVKKAVLKYNINHFVINDSDLSIYNQFEVKSLPTILLIGPNGRIKERYENEEDFESFKKDVKKIVSKHKFRINREALFPNRHNSSDIGNILSFPSKIASAKNFSFEETKNSSVLFIANSINNEIVVSSVAGRIITNIGSTQPYFEDGDLKTASFNNPQGMTYFEDKLYVADTKNHAIRVVDFKNNKVETILGNGERGEVLDFEDNSENGEDVTLYLPTDIKILQKNNKNYLIIANYGTNQIISYDMASKKVSVLAGNGKDASVDGKYPNNSLSKTTDLDIMDGKIFFIDSGSSALRVVEDDGYVKTLIGHKNKKSGFKSGKKDVALMQNPLGLFVENSGIYIVDSFNHALRRYEFSNKEIRNIISNGFGDSVGDKSRTEFDEPSDVISFEGNLYIVDSNNNRVLSINKDNLQAKILDIIPQLKLPTESFVEYLPNLDRYNPVTIKSDSPISLKINISKDFKINEQAPSFINLLKLTSNNEADLVTNFDWQEISSTKLLLPKLKSNSRYILQGVIYYCENKANSLCFVKSYEQRILVKADATKLDLDINLGDQK